ncbi:multidrug resistance protein 1 [Lentibacillus populi]|uniref:Multidrug resistance protein 1 n=1 Tax=Lentibacillus populi TaxID=1827502 RepID=A0A9W5X5I3_9BACI|nr:MULTISPECIES: MFS transporter [Bacillaceae]MBT2214585.1 MFS transporter [Virgibacillus dakarensis]GGB40625.1 multidrug resistance protein 1 [Lentibacillus populi]
MEKKQTMALVIVLINLFLAFLGISLVIPVVPTIMNELHLSGSIVGYLVAAFAFLQLLASPVAGRWVDRLGRKRMIVIGLVIFAFSEFLFGIGQDVVVLFISRMFGGVSAAFIMSAVTAYIADITSLEYRPKALGYMSAAINTGFIIGPGVGGFLAGIGTRVPFFFAAGFALVAVVLSVILLREPERHHDDVQQIPGAQTTGWKRIFAPVYLISFLIIFIFSFGLSSFESLFSLFADHKFGFTPTDIAIMISGGGILGAIFQVVFFGYFIKWFGEIRLIRYCLIFSTVLVFLMTLVHEYYTILAVTVTIFVGFDLMRPAVTNYLSRIAGNEQGFVAGMNSMFTSIGNVIGPVIGGLLFDIDLDYPFYFAAILLAVGIGITFAWKDLAKDHA